MNLLEQNYLFISFIYLTSTLHYFLCFSFLDFGMLLLCLPMAKLHWTCFWKCISTFAQPRKSSSYFFISMMDMATLPAFSSCINLYPVCYPLMYLFYRKYLIPVNSQNLIQCQGRKTISCSAKPCILTKHPYGEK